MYHKLINSKTLLWFYLLTVFSTISAASWKKVDNSNMQLKNVHQSTECWRENTKFGLNMLRNINRRVDPCENFYEFACGNFDDPKSSSVKSDIYDQAYKIMKKRLKKLIKNYRMPFKNKLFKSISDFYYSCENINAYHNYFHEDKVDYLKETISKFGGWPVIEGDNWNDTEFDWIDSIKKLRNIGFVGGHFLQLKIKLDPKTENPIFYLNLPFVEFSLEQVTDLNSLTSYYDYIIKTAVFLGADKTYLAELDESFMFEYNLTLISYLDELADNKSYLVSEMYEKWPSINWLKFFNVQTYPYFNFTNSTTIHVPYPKFVTEFEKLINETPKRIQANYVAWKFVSYSVTMINSRTLYDYRKFYSAALNPSYSTEQDKFNCFETTKNLIEPLVHAFYIREYPVDDKTKKEAMSLFINIKNKLTDLVNTSTWLDNDTKSVLVDKITSIKPVIGYPEELLDDKQLNDYFKDLVITRGNFLKNYLSANYFGNNMELFRIFNRASSVEGIQLFSLVSRFQSGAGYTGSDNMVDISVDLLQGYFFNVNRYKYLNYAVLGETIGHELGHPLDNTHRFLNKSGLACKWSKTSNDVYDKEEMCIVNQYKNYSEEEENKDNTAENIADNIGIKIAYLAYQDWVAENNEEPPLFALPFTPNQLFWISYANKWCQSKSVLDKLHHKVHSTNDKRVIGPLSNSIEFSRDFNCSVGSNMNPIQKCIFF